MAGEEKEKASTRKISKWKARRNVDERKTIRIYNMKIHLH
jgi:hypothetical protein